MKWNPEVNMRQRRSLSKRAFDQAVKRTSLGERTAQMAQAVMVAGKKQTDVATEYGVARSAVSHYVGLVWKAHMEASELPPGFRRITVVLPEDKALVALSWERDEKIKLMQL